LKNRETDARAASSYLGTASIPMNSMNTRILFIEDEPALAVTVSDLLAMDGYHVEVAGSGQRGMERATAGGFDLLIVDLVAPDRSSYDVCREVRRRGIDAAILLLTAKSQASDLVVGLRLGADDYMSKPFDPPDLLARVEALVRRSRIQHGFVVKNYEFGDVAVDFERSETRKGGRPVPMASKEMQLLRYLVNNRARVVSREEILQKVWEYNSEVSSRTIDVHIAWLRQKLEDDPQSPKHIETIRGKGYRFTD
jgi:two-component system alkaline phosphatase synthesis response regulator PhoP